MLIDLTCPVENRGTLVKTKSETNEPYLLLKLFNLSEKTISDISFRVLIYDANGTEIGALPVEFLDVNGAPKSFFAENKAVALENLDNAKHFVVQIDSVKFEDETEYALSEENIVEVDEVNASVDDALLLRDFVPEAICFASKHENYWKCVCGRANKPDEETCVRCGRSAEEMFSKFSSKDKLLDTIENAKQEEALKQQEEEQKRLAEKELKIKKAKKGAVIVLIAIVILGVLSVAGVFTYRLILNSNASKALENGDYFKAYELYKKTGSEKIQELTNILQGNTPENLMFQSGLIAEDEENIYYLAQNTQTYTFELIKENKKTKEKNILTDAAGGSLNVSGEWIYFVDFQNGYIMRISKDGEKIETVLEKGVSHLSVIGSTIYYLQTDYDNPSNLPEEQCQVLASQGQMDTFLRLYKMDAEKKEPKLVSEENMNACYIYGSRIYFLTKSENMWEEFNLCSIDLNGKNKEVVVDVPVATFMIKDDTLYYVEVYDRSKKGQEVTPQDAISYTLYEKNLKTGGEKPLLENYLVRYLNKNDDKLFMIAADRNEYNDYLAGNAESAFSVSLYTMDFGKTDVKTLIAGDVQIFNVCGDDVLAFISSQGMCRVKADGTGFEAVTSLNPMFTEATEETPTTEENIAK